MATMLEPCSICERSTLLVCENCSKPVCSNCRNMQNWYSAKSVVCFKCSPGARTAEQNNGREVIEMLPITVRENENYVPYSPKEGRKWIFVYDADEFGSMREIAEIDLATGKELCRYNVTQLEHYKWKE